VLRSSDFFIDAVNTKWIVLRVSLSGAQTSPTHFAGHIRTFSAHQSKQRTPIDIPYV
jgi:hypothetical protein